MNVEFTEGCKISKNTFEKRVMDTGVHIFSYSLPSAFRSVIASLFLLGLTILGTPDGQALITF